MILCICINSIFIDLNISDHSVCELVYKPEAKVDYVACCSIRSVYEIACQSIVNSESQVQNYQFELIKFNLG